MQIPDYVPKCVVFLGAQRSNGHEPLGTGFLVAYPVADTGGFQIYLITARHVIEEVKRRGDVFSRFNLREGGGTWLRVEPWTFNDHSQIDVAAAPVELADDTDQTSFPIGGFGGLATVRGQGISLADEIFFSGLFSKRPGETENVPIVRVGNVAAMPKAEVNTDWGTLPRAYLIEARSIGGQSGSPVFWDCGGIRMNSRKTGGMSLDDAILGPSYGHKIFLIGLVHGHYVVDPSKDVDLQNKVLTASSLNAGIAIVVPADDIKLTLECHELQKQRDGLRRQ